MKKMTADVCLKVILSWKNGNILLRKSTEDLNFLDFIKVAAIPKTDFRYYPRIIT